MKLPSHHFHEDPLNHDPLHMVLFCPFISTGCTKLTSKSTEYVFLRCALCQKDSNATTLDLISFLFFRMLCFLHQIFCCKLVMHPLSTSLMSILLVFYFLLPVISCKARSHSMCKVLLFLCLLLITLFQRLI